LGKSKNTREKNSYKLLRRTPKMQTKHAMYEIKNALKNEITEALNETYMSIQIEITELTANDTYSVKGSFKVVPFLSPTIKRKGKFEAKLDDNLKIENLKITEDQQ
jgi:hypothetical protein